ncbi:uncharacterized protein LOC107430187 [Ziziphus jujuba]|uniref:Uncharacterized protein LOC107430187 n=2 Tax=Ziziphus jujuba TaxID=326968 RepID=A0A6P4BC09_ZIZJJ|nr:uncharacterized protein LOC107430187 [Ziziphus jujuba]XP_048320053.1 uncharacterized protein LOC107430187 [Ziziphus jujuba]XP_060674412.1 uncharacterized protein LOC107430187 [Ziziphus jujuba]KAH7513888.1 hypothetical protein FEM48_Zijuj11G0030400 [Ziziphus jujuba var. spinosa]
MRGIAALTPAKNKFKQIYPLKGSWGNAATSTPKKQRNNEPGEERGPVTKEKDVPVVAFSRPPPLPPVVGPLVLLSLLETWSGRDGNDN